MKGIWLSGGELALREDLPAPEPGPGEALVRVRLAGICGTDLELRRGYYPFEGVPGHEFVGQVEPSRDAGEWEGARVVGEINAVCGRCASCLTGRPTHCENRSVLGIVGRNGAFAEYLALPVENLHRVPAGVADELAVFTEPLAAALEIREQVAIRPSHRVLVIGAGRLGLLVARTLALTGAGVTVVVRHDRQREILSAWGIRSMEEGQVQGGAADIVVEVTGTPGGFELARQAVRPRGTIVLKSTYRGTVQVDFSALVVDEITLVGSRCGPFAPALDLLAAGVVDPTPLIDGRFPLLEALDAFERAGQPGVLKVLLAP